MKKKITLVSTLVLAMALGTSAVAYANVVYDSTGTNVSQQNKRLIKGEIKDSNGQPVVGAVIESSSGAMAISFDGGVYEISIPTSDSYLEFTFVGLQTTRLSLTGITNYDVVMPTDAAALDDVVVVGYGTQSKATISGSVAQVDGAALQESHMANLSGSLAGRLSGVIINTRSGQPGEDAATILIRGKSTFGDSSPLYVIDGVANRGGIDRLNPSDIESISVLKDASAAIYGAQAGNGVILVTTKRGASGKPVVSYDGSFTLQQPTRRPDFLSSYEFMVYDDEANKANGKTEVYKDIKQGYLDGTLNTNQYGDTNWYDAVISEVAPQTQHSFALRGGSDKVDYYVSAGYLYQEYGFVNTNNDFNTLQARANVDAQVTDNLKITYETSARQENRNAPIHDMGTIFWELYHSYPFLHDYYDNGLPGFGISSGRNPALMVTDAPGYNNVRDNYFQNKFAFELDMPWITDGLKASGYVAYDQRFRAQKQLMDQWDAYTYDPVTDDYINQRENTGSRNINLNQNQGDTRTLSIHARIAYDKIFGKHNISTFVAYEQSKYNYDYFSAYRRDFLSSQIDYLFAGGDELKDNNGYGAHSARQNIFGRANYTYDNKYIIEGTLRYDGSQNFAEGERWGLFPSVSGAWRISRESFMEDVDWIDELKVRASWGMMGNDRVDPFQYLSTYEFSTGAVFGDTPQYYKGLSPDRIGNPSITWEVVKSTNAGFDATLFDNSLSLSAQYFRSYRTNILTPKSASIPDYTGLVLPDQNIGEISNQGIEVELAYNGSIGDFNYYVGGNFAFVRNRVHYFDEAVTVPEWQQRTGNPIDGNLVYKSDGIYQTQEEIDASPHLPGTQPGDIKYVDIDGNGQITANDKYRLDLSATPEITYGISMGASWKNFDINMLWQGQARATQMVRPYSFNFDSEYYDNRWISAEQTPDSKYPRATIWRIDMGNDVNTQYSDFWYHSAAFLRLKSLELAYNIPTKTLEKIGMSRARVYVAGSNLFTISEIKIQDPEATNWYSMVYPLQRTYSIGVSLSF